MKLKINKWEFDITNKDYIMDNGAVYQCPTLEHNTSDWIHPKATTVMGKKQFKQLVKEGLIVYDTNFERQIKSRNVYWIGVKIWRFKPNDDIIKEEVKENKIREVKKVKAYVIKSNIDNYWSCEDEAFYPHITDATIFPEKDLRVIKTIINHYGLEAEAYQIEISY